MSSTLSEGVRVPDIGSTSWGADVNFNWGLLNTCLANISGNVKTDVANTWTATQTFSETISGSIDGVAARAVNDEDGNNIKTALAGKAADNAVVHLAGAETITGDKTFTGAVVTHNITPETDNAYSLGSASNKWSAVYAGAYYYGSTQWGLDQNNTWTGKNTFSSTVYSTDPYCMLINPNLIKGDTSTTGSFSFILKDKTNGNLSPSGIALTVLGQDADGSYIVQQVLTTVGSTRYNNGTRLRINPATANNDATFIPLRTNTIDLGTSGNKWKTLNGINPGALSLPSHSAYVDILSSITHTDWTVNYYTPAINGYIALNVNGCAIIQPYGAYGISAGFYDGTIRINDLRVCLPVIANQTYEIWVLGTVNEARLFACLGNV